jgi:hypothetical protein
MGGALGFSAGVVSLISLGDATARTTNVVICGVQQNELRDVRSVINNNSKQQTI